MRRVVRKEKCGGSRFDVLAADDALAGDDGDVGNGHRSVDQGTQNLDVENGRSSLRGELQQNHDQVSVGGGLNNVHVVSFGDEQIPQVVPHVVANVVGGHAAVAILNAANEKRRHHIMQKGTALGGSRKSLSEGPRLGLGGRRGKENRPPTRLVLADWILGSFGHIGSNSDIVHNVRNVVVSQDRPPGSSSHSERLGIGDGGVGDDTDLPFSG
ncbi:hypothetical protein V6N13_020192 [Hibiscus sabdariffa]|uniref:Uncharacterized protein n=1 Tax=Hibiscus sabdariffa TaxID=183260 RepID=A0ABR2ESS2_9ROSI